MGQLNNKYKRYYGPGRHPLAYLIYYMPMVVYYTVSRALK